MNHSFRHNALAAAMLVLLAATASDERSPGNSRAWPPSSRMLSAVIAEKYGPPDEVLASQMSWARRPPWAKIVVFRDAGAAGRSGRLFESVAYGAVPFDRWPRLDALGHGAAYDPATRELSARTDSEETNFLALNLADDVLQGRRSLSDALGAYDAMMSLSISGKSSPAMNRLLFRPRGAVRSGHSPADGR